MRSSSSSAARSFPKNGIGFPESFQRTALADVHDGMSDITPLSTPHSELASFTFPRHDIPERDQTPVPSPRRVSRSSVMRLENILNDVSISHELSPRSRSVGRSPIQPQFDLAEPSSPGSMTARSTSPDESAVKKKKVKMHRCPECHKDFPRPSGLRTHMNMHTKEKPFACTYPGCTRSFSVVSNAKRHMRTHGMGVSAEDGDQSAIPYVVGFEDPVVAELPDESATARSQPFRLRWISLSSEARRPEVRILTSAAPEGKGEGTPSFRMRGRNPITDG